jgi:hypothetical protein
MNLVGMRGRWRSEETAGCRRSVGHASPVGIAVTVDEVGRCIDH